MLRSTPVPAGSVLAVVVTVGLLLASATGAEAQRQGIALEGRAGVAVPAFDLGDARDAGFSAGFGLVYDLSPRVGLRGDFDVDALAGSAGAGDLRLWRYGAAVELRLLEPRYTWFRLSLRLGAGFTTVDPDPGPTDTHFSTDAGMRLGYDLGPGYEAFAAVTGHAIHGLDRDVADPGSGTAGGGSGTEWVFPLVAGIRLVF